MWKYVSRRIKDSIDKTYYNVLDVKRTWTCSSSGSANNGVSTCGSPDKFIILSPFNKDKSGANFNSSSTNQDDDFKEKIRPDTGCFGHSLIGALTWSSAIVCGWYASQLLCHHRRQAGWNTRCNYSKVLYNPSRAIHTNILSYRALTAPITPVAHNKYFNDSNDYVTLTDDSSEHQHHHVRERKKVIHDYTKSTNKINIEKEETSSQSIDDAVKGLLSVLGDIEFEMGVQNINAGHYETAVSHLKLATSHNHAGATFNLGLCYEQGLGVEKDMKIAQECYQIASQLGHAKAMYNLGVFYAHGLGGLEKNRRAARACFNAAANLGQEDAINALYMRKRSDGGEPLSTYGTTQKSSLLEAAMKLQTVSCT